MALKKFAFNILKTDNYARLGLIETHRGNINTPAFMPVGTQATVKACTIDDIKKTGSEIILGNTYHLMIRPGVDRIKNIGGLHEFMNCDLPILTDSGGFQVMSLSKLNKIDREKGAIFNSHVDGKKFFLSPEESIRIQLALNSDIIMIMDECPKKTDDYDKIKKLASRLSKPIHLLALPVVEYWGSIEKVRMDINPWKWRLSRNVPYITHGIPVEFRNYDDDGELHALPGTDGCDYVHNETFQRIPHATFYTSEIHNAKVAALSGNQEAFEGYQRWFQSLIETLPGVHHYSWFDIERKIDIICNEFKPAANPVSS